MKYSNRLAQLLLQNITFLLFIVVFVIFGLLSPRFFTLQTFDNILKQASFIGIVAVGMTFVILTAGIDLSVGSNMYLASSVAALLMQDFGLGVFPALLACLAVGALFGIINALLITRVRIIPFMATLGTMVAGKGLGLLLTRSVTIPVPDAMLNLGQSRLFGFLALPTAMFILAAIIGHFILTMTPLGRRIYAVGNDEESAKKAGINVQSVIGTVYVISGITAALGGFVAVAQQGVVIPGLGEGYEFNAIAAVVLGGTSLFGGVGTVLPGTVMGAVLIQMIQSGLVYTRVDIYIQPLIMAAIIFLAVLLDAFRNVQLQKLRRRNIRMEKDALPNAAGGD
ncbi:MAG: ABC transporter permease [Caldilineaceae bacterium]|nr:ABC transporter permease [Caldilineaceae bacterium]